MGEYVKDTKKMKFPNLESLENVKKVINDSNEALNDQSRTIEDSPLSEVVSGALGAGIGGAVSFGALWGLGVSGLSAAGITSGLATAGALVGGGMVAGVFVLAAPVAALAAAGVGIAAMKKREKLKEEKESLYIEALKKHNAIIKALNAEANSCKKRIDYLTGINILLQQAIKDLGADLGKEQYSF